MAAHLDDEFEGANGADDANEGVDDGDGDIEHPHPRPRPLGGQVQQRRQNEILHAKPTAHCVAAFGIVDSRFPQPSRPHPRIRAPVVGSLLKHIWRTQSAYMWMCPAYAVQRAELPTGPTHQAEVC